jgi:hypothetical protein
MVHRERPVRFVWPAQRYDRLTRKAAALSAVITAVAAAALSLPIVTVYRAANGEASFRGDVPREVIAFVRLEPPARAVSGSRSRAELPASRRAKPSERLLNSDTGSATSVATEKADNAAATGTAAAGDATGKAPAVGPVATPVGVVAPPVIGAPPPPWGWLPPTQAERDSTAREQERRVAEGRDQHRPVAIPMGGASISVPFLSRGPSREERARDSVIHADNLARLARLAERARAKRDSLLAVKALAGPIKMDSVIRPYDRPR